MKLTTKRNRWYFWRELFSYMIPMILIVGTVDVFLHFMQCSYHPEWSAPCDIIWILGAMYWIFLLLVIILNIVSARRLEKVKKKIENEFLEATKHNEEIVGQEDLQEEIDEKSDNKIDEIIEDDIKIKKKSRPKKIIVEWDSALKNKRKTKKDTKRVTKTFDKKQQKF